jgi:signal transduction histidine kinase
LLKASLAAATAEAARESLRFWKERAAGADAQLARARLEAAQQEAERKRIGDAVILRLARDADAQRALMQRMAVRAYAAADLERERIARDLHDNEAQLLAAARIAIEAPRARARVLLRRLEAELRERVRAIRPASLGRRALRMALEAERTRLIDAGIQSRLLWPRSTGALERAMQEVLYSVAREAVSNIIRHSRAHRVEFRLERVGDRVRLSIVDDGRGIPTHVKSRGIGLPGLAERVELVGGILKIESRRGRTAVIAELHAPAASLPFRLSRGDG